MDTSQSWFLCHCNHAYPSREKFLQHKKSVHPEEIEIVRARSGQSGGEGGRMIQIRRDVSAIELTLLGTRTKTDARLNSPAVPQIRTIPANANARARERGSDWKLRPGTRVTVSVKRLNKTLIRRWNKIAKTKRILTESVDAQKADSVTNEINDHTTNTSAIGDKSKSEIQDGVVNEKSGAILTEFLVKTPTQVKMHKCELCLSWFSLKTSLLEHHEQEHTETPFETALDCQKCGESFLTMANLSSHLVTHNNGLSFGCSQCDKFFPSKRALLGHSGGKHSKGRGMKLNEEMIKVC